MIMTVGGMIAIAIATYMAANVSHICIQIPVLDWDCLAIFHATWTALRNGNIAFIANNANHAIAAQA